MEDKSSSKTNDSREKALLHELADGLQAALNYLEVARRPPSAGDSDSSVDRNLLDKVEEQLVRVRKAVGELRSHLTRTP